jgi:hypothetical protein
LVILTKKMVGQELVNRNRWQIRRQSYAFCANFSIAEDLPQLGEADAIKRRNGKGVRRRGERLPNPPWCLAHKAALYGGFRVCL